MEPPTVDFSRSLVIVDNFLFLFLLSVAPLVEALAILHPLCLQPPNSYPDLLIVMVIVAPNIIILKRNHYLVLSKLAEFTCYIMPQRKIADYCITF